jgi:hypothetical protein
MQMMKKEFGLAVETAGRAATELRLGKQSLRTHEDEATIRVLDRSVSFRYWVGRK